MTPYPDNGPSAEFGRGHALNGFGHSTETLQVAEALGTVTPLIDEITVLPPTVHRSTDDLLPDLLSVVGPPVATHPAGAPARRVAHGGRGLSRYVAALLILDAAAMTIGGVLGRLMNVRATGVPGVPYLAVLGVVVPAWLVMLAGSRAYEGRYLALGSEEFRRVANAAARFTALIAVVVFMFRLEVARGLVVIALPTSSLLVLMFRYAARQALHRLRVDGSAIHRVLVVGDGLSHDTLVARLRSSPRAGLRVVGSCAPVMDGETSLAHVRRAVRAHAADTVAVAHSPGVTAEVLRRLAWTLEGCGVDLLVAPAFTDVAGPRINIRPVSGLPLLQIAAPEFSGVRRLIKATIDAAGAALLLAALSPLLAVAAACVRATSPGPALFTQTRIGRDGRPFAMYKFRSMYADAEQRLADLTARNDHGTGVLFKMRDDPRVTGIGRVLRRYSIDEIPQLINVLLGQMSLVGPRPPLPAEVARYERDVHRRLMVKPGLTGLWQVSGRSDLDWNETVRLDLYYVENWSVVLDVEILARIVSAVLRGAGAR
jgi:exopolysaccharide biosynthesis polyprenyl glycosylphosphotransferase